MFWNIIAWVVTRGIVFDWLKTWAFKRPYKHIRSPDGESQYMGRWWVIPRYRNWPCIRLHHIQREDMDRHLHSHPFSYRTVVLRGYYVEERPIPNVHEWDGEPFDVVPTELSFLSEGDTATNKYKSFHRITEVSAGGVWTLFVMWGGKRGDWGFLTENGYVSAKDYAELMNREIKWK